MQYGTERNALVQFCACEAEHRAAAEAAREGRLWRQRSYRMMVNAALAFAQAAAAEQSRLTVKYAESIAVDSK